MSPAPPDGVYEVAVIGGGPAGATAARLLAEWGHTVVLLGGPESPPPLGESLPPSTRKLLAAVGALGLVEGAGFLPTTGHTSWWGTDAPRIERFPDQGRGFQVLRRDLQELLLRAAVTAGVRVAKGTRVREVHHGRDGPQELEVEDPDGARTRLRALQVLDASGRAGVVARHGFRTPEGPRTLAVAAVFERPSGFRVPDDTHTLVEAHAEGWAWSVPVAPERRHVTVMLDPPRDKGPGLLALYEEQLGRAPKLRARLAGARRTAEPWALDASAYTARAVWAPGVALVGDAASFIDPLSSFGVKKALASAWLAAVATHTSLLDPARRELAFGFFARREAQVYARYSQETARVAAEAALLFPGSRFWSARAVGLEAPVEGDDDALASEAAVRDAFARLKAGGDLRLGLAPGVRALNAPVVEGREVVQREALCDSQGRTAHFAGRVGAVALARLMPDRVGPLLETYLEQTSGVELGELLFGLSTLVAAGFLRAEDAPGRPLNRP